MSAFFHRDAATVAGADAFTPDRWSDGSAEDDWSLIPFSAGPVVCPGRELVLFTAGTFLAALLEHHDAAPVPPFPLDARRPMPAALDACALRFALPPRAG